MLTTRLRRRLRLPLLLPGVAIAAVAALPGAPVLAAGAPVVSSITPSSGSGCGGDTVTIHGNGFGGVTTVTFGTGYPGSVTHVLGNSITAITPAHPAGTVDVIVSSNNKMSSPNPPADQFTFNAGQPSLTSVTPNIETTAGGVQVTIAGTCLLNVTSVTFGANAATSFHVVNDTQITAVPPASTTGEGTVAMTVTTATGHASLPFTYKNPPQATAPTVTSVVPASGPTSGGNSVTINGTGFFGGGASCNISDVDFGDLEPSVIPAVCTDTSITVVAPAGVGPGTVDALVTTNNGGTSAINQPGDEYTYLVTYFFAWYDKVSDPGFRNDNIHVMNPAQSGTAHVNVHIPSLPPNPDCEYDDQSIPAQSEMFFSCSTGYGGPVTVSSDSRVIASQRVQFYTSFNEVPAMAGSAAAMSLQFAWYDHLSSAAFAHDNDNIHVINPGASTAHVNVTIPGSPACTYTDQAVPAGGFMFFSCSTGFGGPVTVTSTDNPVLASQRLQYGQSFNEEWGQAPGTASGSRDMTWFDHTSDPGFLADNIHVWNPTGALSPGQVTGITIPGCASPNADQVSADEIVYSCPFGSGYGGPVTITASVSVLASQRVQFYSTFNEVPAVDPLTAANVLYFLWYDHISDQGFINGNDNIHVIDPGGTAATVDITIPGNPACSIVPTTPNVPAGGEAFFNCSTGYGGPVVISSDQPVLASQRVQYYQSFNEVNASA